jgi:hypothetical protein
LVSSARDEVRVKQRVPIKRSRIRFVIWGPRYVSARIGAPMARQS